MHQHLFTNVQALPACVWSGVGNKADNEKGMCTFLSADSSTVLPNCVFSIVFNATAFIAFKVPGECAFMSEPVPHAVIYGHLYIAQSARARVVLHVQMHVPAAPNDRSHDHAIIYDTIMN